MDRLLSVIRGAGSGVKVGDGGLRGESAAEDAIAQAPKTDDSSWAPVGASPLSVQRTDISGHPDKGLQQEGSAEHLELLHVLVVDDDEAVRKACCQIAAGMGFAVVGADSATAARAILKHQRIDLLLLDLKLPGGGGLPLLEQVKALHPDTAVIVMTAFATVSSAVEAMRIGAGDYLTKPFALEELTTVLERAAHLHTIDVQSRLLRERLRTQQGMGGLVGHSPEMEKLYRILSKVAYSTHPVLILGESGTGKELVARSIHFNGPNSAKPFVPVDCGSLVPTLIESELFGHVKGAFTGADRTKEGLLSSADGGDRKSVV